VAKVLIIGVDSAIGRAVAQGLCVRGDEVIGTSRRSQSDGRGFPGARISLDLASPDAVETDLPDVDFVIFCAAMARYADCRQQPDPARAVNLTVPAALARRLVERGAHAILLSTSAVFDCQSPLVPADRKQSPKSAYGVLKADAEVEFLALGRRASILRLTKVIAPDLPLFVNWIDALARGQHVRAFADLSLCPIAIGDAVRAIVAVLDDASGGIYQASGGEDISYLDAARHLALRLDVPPGLVEAARAVDHGIPETEVARYTSLDASRLTALMKWQPPNAVDVLDSVFGPVLRSKKVGIAQAS
jgi:dTDP-4-dehydrorhamnose reductase